MTVSKKVRNNAKNQFAKIKYDARKANMENIQIKAQRAETLQQLETEKTKILTLFCTRSCTYSYYSAAKLLQK
jgi:hypothetical protein